MLFPSNSYPCSYLVKETNKKPLKSLLTNILSYLNSNQFLNADGVTLKMYLEYDPFLLLYCYYPSYS